MKRRVYLFVCLITWFLGVSGQVSTPAIDKVIMRSGIWEFITPVEMSKMAETPELMASLFSIMDYEKLYGNEMDSLNKAMTRLDEVIALHEDMFFPYMFKSRMLFKAGKENEALSLLDSVSKKDGCPIGIPFLVGKLYEKKGDHDCANRYYDQVLEKSRLVVNGGKCTEWDFFYHLFVKYFIDRKVMTMEEVKALLPENLKDMGDEPIKQEISYLYGNFDRESYMKNLWNNKISQ